MEKHFYVYHHINKLTDEVFYVGKGKGNRAYSKRSRSEMWHNIVNKYDYDVLIVESNLTDEESCNREIYWIVKIGRRNLGLGPLVNFTDGGDGIGGYIFTEEVKQKMSESHSGEKNGFYGKQHSLETRQKMSEAKKGKTTHMKGKQLSDETKEKLRNANLGKKLSPETKQKLSEALKGRPGVSRPHTKEARLKIRAYQNSELNKKRKAVLQYDLEGNLIKEWPSVSEVHKTLKIYHIDAYCRGVRKNYTNFNWKYKDDEHNKT
jgi:hypothetical protein